MKRRASRAAIGAERGKARKLETKRKKEDQEKEHDSAEKSSAVHAAAALSNHIQAPGLCPPARAVRISRTTYIPVCFAFATPHETTSSKCGRLFDDCEIAVSIASLANRCQTVHHKIWRLWRMARVFDKDVAAHMKRLGMIRFSARRPAEVLVHLPRAFKPISRLLWSLNFHLKIVVYLLLATDLYCSDSHSIEQRSGT